MSSATHAMVSSAMQPRFTAGERDYVSPQISRINYTRRSRTLAAPALQKRALSTLIIPNARRPTSRGSATVVSMSSDKEAITAVLNKYEAALNESSTDKVMELYAPNGVFMPQHSPSSEGTAAVKKAYDFVFEMLTLAVKFKIVEVVPVTSEWAFARTESAGKQTIHAIKRTTDEANQELFVFQKVDGEWKIARYCFCTTNPPPGPSPA